MCVWWLIFFFLFSPLCLQHLHLVAVPAGPSHLFEGALIETGEPQQKRRRAELRGCWNWDEAAIRPVPVCEPAPFGLNQDRDPRLTTGQRHSRSPTGEGTRVGIDVRAAVVVRVGRALLDWVVVARARQTMTAGGTGRTAHRSTAWLKWP